MRTQKTESANEDGFQTPPQLWMDSFADGKLGRLHDIPVGATISSRPYAMSPYGVANHRRVDDEHFAYMIAQPVKDAAADDEFVTREIPEYTYVVLESPRYPANDRSAMQKQVNAIQRRFYVEWLPTVSYEKEDGPEFEVYYQNGCSAWLEMWYPIRNENKNSKGAVWMKIS